jgi:CDP-4-dehydro-6-deoxyglucose reductase
MKRLQAVLQWLFLRVEGVFNAAFGDRANPLYHLGAITFLLFWVVGASGLYLYAFFETGVSDAYASVESLTHRQWWAGGILRSVHRYASDAMVVTMLLHLLRHFAFDRIHGFRAFSWLTGVALIWGVYASGINGYMLPWDRLAQFVIVTTFEWIDALPGFGGTLMRNFIHSGSVGDRFFSLLSFMHIGLPLVVLLLMWVHVQRVPKAATTPPRPITIGVLATMLLLSLVRPVLSQGGAADLATAVAQVRLDWFYLPLFPLLVSWPPGQAWALVMGGTAFLVVLPWLRRRAEAGAPHQLVVHAGAAPPTQTMVRAGETLLEAALRAGVAAPYQCRNGGCGVCLCSVEQGRVKHRPYQRSALPDAALAQGKALMCCAVPETDTVVELILPSAVRMYTGTVVALDRLADEVMRVRIALPEGERLSFSAGQYIDIVLPDGARRAFSFANPPHDNALVELHVRRIPGGRFTPQVFESLRVGDTLRFEGPFGHFNLRESPRPIVLVAAATGFAPVKSIVEDALHRGVRRAMVLYWGVRSPRDLYLLELPERWAREHANFRFVPVVSEPRPGDGWSGRTGLVHEAILADFGDLAGQEVYVCGSARMVETAVASFTARGLDEGACFSDAFVPRQESRGAESQPGSV